MIRRRSFTRNLIQVLNGLTLRNLQECYNDAIYYRDEIRQQFLHGKVSLRERTVAERLFWMLIKRIAQEKIKLPKVLLDKITSGTATVFAQEEE